MIANVLQMPLTRRLFPLFIAAIIVLATIEMIRRRKLREEYAILWVLASLVMLAFAAFPVLVIWLSQALRVNYLTVIVLSLFGFMAIIMMHFAMVVSRQSEQIRQLTQRVAILTAVTRGEVPPEAEPTSSAIAGHSPADRDTEGEK
ncbi:MAG: DUF2304 domain-containing protein [Phycisphaerae bacterium]